VPYVSLREQIVRALMDAASEVLRSWTPTILFGGVLLITAALLVPRIGLLLALGLVVASVGGYGSQVRAGAVEPPSGEVASGAPGLALTSDSDGGDEHEDEVPPRWAVVARGGLWVVAALALVAPALVRNRGYALPPAGSTPGVLGLIALAFAGWLAMPVALAAAYAQDHRGPLPPRLALAALVRHPLAALAALVIFPLGLLLTEATAAFLAWQQGQLPLMVVDLFPPPRIQEEDDGKHVYFQYDSGPTLDENCSENMDFLCQAYPHALRRGFTLTGTIPPSLAIGLLQVRAVPEDYRVDPAAYLTMRILVTVLILGVAGVLLTLQARWLGLIVALGSRRPAVLPHVGHPGLMISEG
jgi:hypothetical protein